MSLILNSRMLLSIDIGIDIAKTKSHKTVFTKINILREASGPMDRKRKYQSSI